MELQEGCIFPAYTGENYGTVKPHVIEDAGYFLFFQAQVSLERKNKQNNCIYWHIRNQRLHKISLGKHKGEGMLGLDDDIRKK